MIDYFAEIDGPQSINNGKLGRTLYKGGGKGKKPEYAAMRPANVTTGFGKAIADPETGNYSYKLNPRLAEMRDYFYGGANDYIENQGAQQQLFGQDLANYGQGKFEQATQYDLPTLTGNYYNQQQDIMARQRAENDARLSDQMFSTGRMGYGQGVSGGYINPQQFALQKAREEQNAQLYLGAEDRARSIQQGDINLGLGLYGQGQGLQTSPYATAASIFGLGTDIEQLGAKSLDYGMNALQFQAQQQQNQQKYNNAKAAASGGKGGLGSAISGGIQGFATGGWGGALGGALGGATGIPGLSAIGGGLDLGSWTNPFSSVTSAVSGFGGMGSQMDAFGSGYSSLLGGNAIAPNYSIGPKWI